METLLCFLGVYNLELLLIGKIPCKAIFKSSVPLNEFGRQLSSSQVEPGAGFPSDARLQEACCPGCVHWGWAQRAAHARRSGWEARSGAESSWAFLSEPPVVGDVFQCLRKLSCGRSLSPHGQMSQRAPKPSFHSTPPSSGPDLAKFLC